jgi:hypothetical protein
LPSGSRATGTSIRATRKAFPKHSRILGIHESAENASLPLSGNAFCDTAGVRPNLDYKHHFIRVHSRAVLSFYSAKKIMHDFHVDTAHPNRVHARETFFRFFCLGPGGFAFLPRFIASPPG